MAVLGRDVRYWHKADIRTRTTNVRHWGVKRTYSCKRHLQSAARLCLLPYLANGLSNTITLDTKALTLRTGFKSQSAARALRARRNLDDRRVGVNLGSPNGRRA